MVTEYFDENIHYLISQEKVFPALGNYVGSQKAISENSRAKLIDWLAELHYKYKMFPETLFTIVTLVDRFLSAKTVPLP